MTSGPFRWIRHPFYSSYIFGWLGAAVIVYSVPIIIAAFMSYIYWIAAKKEENLILSSHFSYEYKGYLSRTGMFIPKI